jgi:hypothetical protein
MNRLQAFKLAIRALQYMQSQYPLSAELMY